MKTISDILEEAKNFEKLGSKKHIEFLGRQEFARKFPHIVTKPVDHKKEARNRKRREARIAKKEAENKKRLERAKKFQRILVTKNEIIF